MSEQQVDVENNLEQDPPEESAAETKAREMGWKPAEEWEGDTSRHLTAEQFVDRNEFLQQRADKIAQAEISRLRSEVSDLKTTISDLGSHMKKADQRALERARKELQTQMDSAVEEGDTDAYNRAKQGIADLDEEVQEATKGAEAAPNNADNDPAFIAWHKDNDWYGPDGDVKATIYAEEIAPVVARKYQGADLYDEITKRVRQEFPDLFKPAENSNRRKPPPVEGASAAGGGGKTLWSKVDKEGREAFARFVKQGVFEDKKEDREQYARDYVDE